MAIAARVPLRERLLSSIALHQSGDIDAASAGYRAVLEEQPRQFDALRLLGAALWARGDAASALALYDRAIAVRADFAEVWTLRAEALERLGRIAEAVQSIERSLALAPHQAAAWTRLGMWLDALDRPEQARNAAERVVALAPEVAVAWSNLALAHDRLGHPVEALACYDRALALDAAAPDDWCARASVLNRLRRPADALASYERALALAPDLAAAHGGRAAPLRALGDLAAALAATERALALAPQHASAWAQRGCTLAALGDYAQARQSLRRAVQIAPHDRQARFNLGAVELTLGDLAAGWQGYEERAHATGLCARTLPATLPGVPVWDGRQELAGRCIVLHAEQGLGDAIQFCRYATVLARDAAQVILVVPPALQGLLHTLDGGVCVLADRDPLPPVDLQCRLLSLPHRLGTRLETIPGQVPYLHPGADQVRDWRVRLEAASAAGQGAGPQRAASRAGRILRIGLACSGNPDHANDAQRSIALAQFLPVVQALAAAIGARDVEWHLLQDRLRAADGAAMQRLGIVDHRAQLADLAQTAALACCMDAVVSVDTALAHLAGALGRPLYVLLPHAPDWRWLLDREDSPWYPSARLLRQPGRGSWEPVLARLAGLLRSAFAA